jgi:hypothetical protein
MFLVLASLVYLLIAYSLFWPHALINNILPNFLVLNAISYYNRIKGAEEREIPLVRLQDVYIMYYKIFLNFSTAVYWYIPDGMNNYDVGCLRVEIFLHNIGYDGLTFLKDALW